MRIRQLGMTFLEFSVVAVVLAILAAVLLNRLNYYQELAEKARMEATVQALQSGLRFEMARQLMEGRRIDHRRLARENPMNWMEQRPADYRGELPPGGTAGAVSGWYYDGEEEQLVYLPNLGSHLAADARGRKEIRFGVEVARRQGGADSPVPLRLKPVEPYLWFRD